MLKEFEILRDLLKNYNSPAGAKRFFESPGYPAMEPLPIELEKIAESARKSIVSVHQLVKIGGSSSFRIFHVELKPGKQGQILRQPLRRFLESFYKHYSQGENLFVFTSSSSYEKLIFVSPRRLPDRKEAHDKVRLWLRILQVDRNRSYRTDLETLSKIRADGIRDPDEIWKRHDEAFSVQRVTEQFYREVFNRIREYLKKTHKGSPGWAHDYTHQLLNRIMFLYFIARKGWLLGSNGGLYTVRPGLDDRLQAFVPDEYFALLFEEWTDGAYPGFFERYNFTVVETSRFDEEVAVDPKMLGMVYERLVNVTFESGERVEAHPSGDWNGTEKEGGQLQFFAAFRNPMTGHHHWLFRDDASRIVEGSLQAIAHIRCEPSEEAVPLPEDFDPRTVHHRTPQAPLEPYSLRKEDNPGRP